MIYSNFIIFWLPFPIESAYRFRQNGGLQAINHVVGGDMKPLEVDKKARLYSHTKKCVHNILTKQLIKRRKISDISSEQQL